MKSRNKKRLLALVLCMVVAISNSSFIFASETGQAEYPQEAEVQTQDEAVADDMDVAAYAADEGQAVADEQPAAVEQVAAEPAAEPETIAETQEAQPVAEAPAAEQPTTEEPAVQEPAAAPTEETPGTETVVEGEESQEEESEEQTEKPVTYEQIVEGVRVVVTTPNKSVLPENAELIVTKIDNTEEIEQIKDTIAPEVANNQTSIKDLMAFDIKFMADGQEVQPNSEVKVEFQNTGYETENGISVYHVDDEKTAATDMAATIETQATENADVAIDTTHFSTYVVVNNGSNKINVTIEHYLYDETTTEPSQLYKSKTVELASGTDGQQLSQFTMENDEFGLRENEPVVKRTEDGKETPVADGKIEVDSNVTIRCYYVAKSGKYTNGVTMFDYDITGGGASETKEGSWSDGDYVTITVGGQSHSGYYRENKLYANSFYGTYWNDQYTFTIGKTFTYNNKTCTWKGDGKYAYEEAGAGKGINTLSNYRNPNSMNNKMMMGQANETELQYKYMVDGVADKNGYNGNQQYDINANNQSRQPIIPGIVTSLSGDNYSQVNFKEGLDEPGFFSSDSKIGKRILDDYNLNFTKTGNKYTLTSVSRGGPTVASDLKNFWPLDGNLGTDGLRGVSDDNGAHNWYFAMRYDFKFKLGDYMGDLTYSFIGDDDLWVFMDGQPIIDLGGLHSAYPVNSFSTNPPSGQPASNYDYSAWHDRYPNTVNLWEKLGGKEGADRKKEHTITVLFMERGGYGSNCNMEFVLPNVTSTEPVISTTPKADLSLTKVDSKEAPITGAEFKLVSGNSEVKATSDDSGKVTFANLKEGTEYTLTEEKAPDNYVTEITTWTVKIEKDASGTLKAVLYKGAQPLEVNTDGTYHIINYTQKELIEQSVESDKKVSLLDWDQRTYKIDLTASSKVTQSTTVSVPFDIVMVLDVSGSMKYSFYEYSKYTGDLRTNGQYYIKTSSGIYEKINYSKDSKIWKYHDTYKNEDVTVTQGSTDIFTKKESITKLKALQNAATSFVDNVATKNPDNRISVVTFAEDSTIKTGNGKKYLLRTGDSLNTIKSWINNLSANGATNSAAGLGSAVNVFDSKNSGKWENVTQNTGRQKMVVFLTDGVPTKSNEFSSTVAQNAIEKATKLKNQGAVIYSLGIFDSADSKGEISEGTVKQIDEYMKGVASSEEKYMTADSVSSLYGLFDSITNSMPVAVKATVTDVIDSRFELTADSRAKLESDGAVIKINSDGSTTITWKDTEILGKKDSETTDIKKAGWHKEIYIKAKDEYIGGNDVPTNGAGSGIDVGNNHAEFPQPTVNVKVDFNIGKDKTVIFKGDALSRYFNVDVANGITKLVSTTGPEYTMLDDVNVSIKWYTDAEYTNETTKEAIQAAKPAADTVYHAKVTVTPKTDGSASSANSVGDKKVPGDYYKVDSSGVAKTGTYTVKVVSGAIQIEKQLETKAAKDETFTFSIKGTDVDGFIPIDVSITIKAGETQGTLSNKDLAKLKSLPRGTYEVTEVDTNGYTIQDVKATDKTNCYSKAADDKVSFTLGSDSEKKDVIKETTYATAGILGVAAFTNEKVTSDWGIKKVSASNKDYTISGAVFILAPTAGGSSYYGKSQDGGTVKWYRDSDCTTEITETIQKGRYTLSEITAPTGYVRSTETWSIEIASKGALKSIQSGGKEIAEDKIKKETVGEKEVVYYLYENEVVYDLPSTGHTGIFNILMSGILLMFAGILIIYKMKGKEVLKK